MAVTEAVVAERSLQLQISTAALTLSSFLFTTRVHCPAAGLDTERTQGGLFGCNVRHCMPVSRVHASKVHICKRTWLLFHCVKCVFVRIGLYLLHDDSSATGDEVTTVVVGEGVIVHLALESACCIVGTPAQRGSSHSNCVHIFLDENQDGNVAFEATLPYLVPHSWLQ